MTLRLVCLSDTHSAHGSLEVPDGDLLLHAGDFTKRGRPQEIERFGRWLGGLPHRHKVLVPGNHDFLCEREPDRARELLGDVVLLDGGRRRSGAGEADPAGDPPAPHAGGIELAGLRLWGSPWQPWFHDWAFNLPRGEPLARHWATAPSGVDVLVTHTPPHGVLDRTVRGEAVGCEALAAALPRIAPRLHVFGHIHEDRGAHRGPGGRLSVNACSCDLSYRAVHPPVVVDWDADGPRLVSGA
jgi:hypothetical protein